MLPSFHTDNWQRWLAYAGIGGLGAWWLQNTTLAFWTFIIMACLDILTGIIVAWQHHDITSAKFRDGFAKKVIAIILVGAAAAIEPEFTAFIPTGLDLSDAIALTFTIGELLSIIENAAKGEVAVPPLLLEIVRLAQMKPKGG